MDRREFLALLPAHLGPAPQGTILVHEHVMVDFVGADLIRPGRYDQEEVFRLARPKLEQVRKLGCRRLLEATPDFLGRDARLMQRLAQATGLEIWINTGIYGAAGHRYVPSFARQAPARELAQAWIGEAKKGVDGVRPRFIKTGVNRAPLSELDRKLVEAAGLASRETGLPIASHTGGAGPAAMEQLEILSALKLDPGKFVWVHAQNERDHAMHEKVARAGAWIEFDGIRPATAAWHAECVRRMAARGLLERVLVSQDAGWYHVGEPGGGNYRGYTSLYTDFLPLVEAGWVKTLLMDNPVRAFGD